MSTIRLDTPSKSVVRLGAFSITAECDHCCGEYFEDAEAAREFADGINFNWHSMRRSLAAITEEECHDMANNPFAFMGPWWEHHKQPRREAQSGRLRVRFRTNEQWLGWLSDDQLTGRMVPPGTWAQLVEEVPIDETDPDSATKTVMWMTDTPIEVADQMEFYEVAHGRVLINGLGLGMMQEWILRTKPCVEHMDIVEVNEDVIRLIAPYFDEFADRVTIHHADALEMNWPKGSSWDVVFHDIWPSISATNLPEMTRLMRKYGQRAQWQGCWARRECEEMAQREKDWKGEYR
jgi:hypothetical protein